MDPPTSSVAPSAASTAPRVVVATVIPGPPAQLSTTTPASSQSASVPGTAATSALTPSAATALSGKRTFRLYLIRSALNTGGLATYVQSVQRRLLHSGGWDVIQAM